MKIEISLSLPDKLTPAADTRYLALASRCCLHYTATFLQTAQSFGLRWRKWVKIGLDCIPGVQSFITSNFHMEQILPQEQHIHRQNLGR